LSAASRAQAGRLEDRAAPQFTALSRAVAATGDGESAQAAAELRSSRNDYNLALALAVGLLALVLLTGLLIAYFVSRAVKLRADQVLRRLNSLRDHCITDVNNGLKAL